MYTVVQTFKNPDACDYFLHQQSCEQAFNGEVGIGNCEKDWGHSGALYE